MRQLQFTLNSNWQPRYHVKPFFSITLRACYADLLAMSSLFNTSSRASDGGDGKAWGSVGDLPGTCSIAPHLRKVSELPAEEGKLQYDVEGNHSHGMPHALLCMITCMACLMRVSMRTHMRACMA